MNLDPESSSARLCADHARLIHELEQAQHALAASETRLKLVSKAITSIVIDWDLSTNQFYRVNSPEDVTGFGPDEVASDFESLRSGIHPDDLPRFDKSMKDWLEGTDSEFRLVVRSRHKDGTYRDLSGQGIMVREEGTGRPLRIVASYTDVTPERQALRTLQTSEERYRLANEAIQGIVFDWDLTTNYIFRSSGVQRLLGYPADEVEPRPEWWRSKIHPDDQQAVFHDLEEFIRAGDSHGNLYYRIRHQGGHYLYVHANFMTIRDDGGQAKRIVGCIVDLTPRIQAEQAQRRREQLSPPLS
ncbi:MAG: PAS domain-containing protein [Gemmatales bacterium]